MVVLFGYVFGSAISVPGGGDYREYLMPGLFAMVTFTAAMTVTMRVATDASRGVMDRFRSMPMARAAVPFGQTGAEILNGLLGMAIAAAPHRRVARPQRDLAHRRGVRAAGPHAVRAGLGRLPPAWW